MADLETFTWYHWRAGWYFARRKGTGDVAIKRVRNGETQEIIIIPKDEWASIVASVSKRGETGPQYKRAGELHG